MLKSINEKAFPRYNHVKIHYFHGGTKEAILEKVEDLGMNKSSCLIVYTTNNNYTKV